MTVIVDEAAQLFVDRFICIKWSADAVPAVTDATVQLLSHPLEATEISPVPTPPRSKPLVAMLELVSGK